MYSYRDFRVGFFEKEFKSCKAKPDRYACERKVRSDFRSVESGRYAEMTDKIHNFLTRLDSDEVELLKNDVPKIIDLANDFAFVEEVRKL